MSSFRNIQIMAKETVFDLFEQAFLDSNCSTKGNFIEILLNSYKEQDKLNEAIIDLQSEILTLKEKELSLVEKTDNPQTGIFNIDSLSQEENNLIWGFRVDKFFKNEYKNKPTILSERDLERCSDLNKQILFQKKYNLLPIGILTTNFSLKFLKDTGGETTYSLTKKYIYEDN